MSDKKPTQRTPAPQAVAVRLSPSARDGLRREAGRRQAEDGSEWTLSRVVEALLAERRA